MPGTPGPLEDAREHYRRRAWAEAHEGFMLADRAAPLEGADLELLAMTGYLLGRDSEYLGALERAHGAYLATGQAARAARCAFWIALRLALRGEPGHASGWMVRAERLVERLERPSAEQGYLLLFAVDEHLLAGEREEAFVAAASAVEIGEAFGEPDLTALARHLQGRIRVLQGRIREGLALLDEAMLSASGGELSPLATGLIYCSLIECCRRVYALRRAREWTAALARWCDAQPDMVAFSGVCRVHRAELMALEGDWAGAVAEARRARNRLPQGDRPTTAAAYYQEGEVHRLRGELAEAETAYRLASGCGLEPQPGLALLRLAQRRPDAACAGLRRELEAASDPLLRARLLPGYVEILLAAGEPGEASAACRELEETAERIDSLVLWALAAQARGAVELADGNARASLDPLRRAAQAWQEIDAPYPTACVRALIGLACRALGDEEGGRMELEAARASFERLGAAPDVARLDALAPPDPEARPHGLTRREREVLCLVAAGMTNKDIARRLFLSQKTVDRHLSSIFRKLDVSSRAAATAFAFKHNLT